MKSGVRLSLWLCSLVLLWCCSGCSPPEVAPVADVAAADPSGRYHVRPGDALQPVLDAAARSETKHVIIHAGTYAPSTSGQAFIVILRRHDGLLVEGQGEVILTAENRELSSSSDLASSAVVNHVVYFGDGVTPNTKLRGVTIRGAGGYVHDDPRPVELNQDQPALVEKGMFYYLDGGAVKIFGRSAPTIEDCVFRDNSTQLCGGGISVEHRGTSVEPVRIRNCKFIDNRCPGTGAAIDLLSGSIAEIENCLFVGNIANTGMDEITKRFRLTYKPEHGCGALTVFPDSRVVVRRSTFTANWNGVDDMGRQSLYQDCLFWQNTATDGSRPGRPYEMDVIYGAGVTGCMIGGGIVDLQDRIDPQENNLQPEDPMFDADYVPRAAGHENVGYRPKLRDASETKTSLGERN